MSSRPPFASHSSEPVRRAEVTIRLSEFEIPPMQDVLLVGKRAPIGPEAVRRMVDALTPDQYDIIYLDHEIFEAAVLKRSLLKFLPQEKFLPVILEEGMRVATENTVVKAQVNIVVQVNRAVDL
ncbi:hypothetical protein Desku_0355 [Desulfofundulus kuznetsovii DSM 6115]|uniref:Uncharacterized protein n=1 Tax=Desulfofundulus kuznetsovii (strain DSM 6115 / VKM B-1805 / 17) TaxID=760568 RepID=A0AAU8P874_DESK7|nr:hypothetical protein Desku_0355 [Desulfofundulus kuznetsovii DSM 6115]